MRFFAGGLNHAKTLEVHTMSARNTTECAACLLYLQQKAAGLRPRTLPDDGVVRR